MFCEREMRTNLRPVMHFFATSIPIIIGIWLQNHESKKFAEWYSFDFREFVV